MKMLKYFLIFLCTMAWAAHGSETIRINLTAENPIISQTQNGIQAGVPGYLDRYMVYDWPEIPSRTIVQSLPFGSNVLDVRSVDIQTEEIALPGPPAPGPGLHLISDPSRKILYPVRDAAIPYPEKTCVWMVNGGRNPEDFQFNSMLVIRAFPFQFLPDDMLRIIRRQTIEITYDPPERIPPQVLVARDPSEPYIIVTSESLLPSAAGYTEYRANLGISVGIYTIESILPAYGDPTDEAKLRHFIRDRVEQDGTVFVLLLGDSEVIPVHRPIQENDLLGAQRVPVEFYYGDLYDSLGNATGWDADQNGICGVYPQDLPDMDFLPDVFVSRIPASTQAEALNALTHVISYESSTQSTDDWFNTVILTAVDTFNPQDHGDTSGVPEGEQYAEFLADMIFPGMRIVRMYETDVYPHDGPSLPLPVTERLSEGAGFAAFHCHGAPDCFWLTGACFDSTHAKSMANGNRLPLMYGFACSTAAFDNELPEWPYTSQDESMPEHFLLYPQGGTISYVGATRVAYASSFLRSQHLRGSGAMEYGYYQGYRAGMLTPGQMMAAAQKWFLENIGINDYLDFYTFMEHAHFGDPTVFIGGLRDSPEIRDILINWECLNEPAEMCFKPGSEYAADIRFLNSGRAVEGLRAVLDSLNPEVTVTGEFQFEESLPPMSWVDSGPVFIMNIPANYPLSAQIILRMSVFSQQTLLHQADLLLMTGTEPHLTFSSFQIHGDSSGNGNVDPGDTIYPAVFVRNTGCAACTGVTVELTTSSPYVDECGSPWSNASVDIPPGWASFSSWASAVFHVMETCPDQAILPFLMTWRCDGGNQWAMPFDVTVSDLQGPRLSGYSVSDQTPGVNEPVIIRTEAYDISGIMDVGAVVTSDTDGTVNTVRLLDDGLGEDATACDGIYTGVFIPSDPPEDYHLDLTAADGLDNQRLVSNAAYFSAQPYIPAEVLVISSSAVPDAGNRIGAAVEETGRTAFVWNVLYRGFPDKNTLMNQRYRSIVWTFGYSRAPDMGARDLIAGYLDSGGALVISGWDVAKQLQREGGEQFMADYFGVDFKGNSTDFYLVEGVAGDPVGDTIEFSLRKRNGEDQTLTADRIMALEPARSCLFFSEAPNLSGGVYRATDSIRTMFLPYALESIKDSNDTAQFLSQTLAGFDERMGERFFNLNLNAAFFSLGTRFHLSFEIGNPDDQPLSATVIVALCIGDRYWFWPDWTEDYGKMMFETRIIEPRSIHDETILDFVWPDVEASMNDVAIYGVMVDPLDFSMLEDMTEIHFGF